MQNEQKRVVVIGAGYAGLLATVRLAGKVNAKQATITLVNEREHFVERLRLHQFAANATLKERPLTETLRGTGVKFVRGRVTRLDLAQHTVETETTAGIQHLPYDYLLYALGSQIDQESVAGVRQYAYTFVPDGPLSATALRAELPGVNQRHGRLVVCGGGATGIEAAAEFAARFPHLQVRLVTQGELGSFLGKPIAAHMRQQLEKLKVVIQDHTLIRELSQSAVVTAGGATIPYDLCLWTGGFTVPDLARVAGLAVNERGQIRIDPFMRAISHPEVYAIGDAAQPAEEPGAPVRMSAYAATVMGAHGADCLAAAIRGKTPQPFSFAYAGQGIALGPKNAIGFNNYPNDRPNRPYFTGYMGYAIREFFVNLLAGLPAIERRIPGFFYWLGKGRYAAAKRRVSSVKEAGQVV